MADAATGVAGELERLAALRSQGVLTDDEFAAQKGRVLGTPQEKGPSAVAVASLEAKAVGDLWVYVLLVLPLLMAALVIVAPGNGPVPFVGKFLFAPSLIFVLLDHGRMKGAGLGLPLWQMGAAFCIGVVGLLTFPAFALLFVPAYLLLRARKLRRGYGYIALWFAAFAVLFFATWFVLGNHATPAPTL
ncbi:MAG: hypothetical protein DI629_14965 [Mesorhizobium amorphae]|nr:MAG: hypothetical protein DI629_14965 [Mesorhizobium amorphae]